jgi:hypothetical protein
MWGEGLFRAGTHPRQTSGEAICLALKRLEVHWKRAKHWITGLDPVYRGEKQRNHLIRLASQQPTWALSYADEV